MDWNNFLQGLFDEGQIVMPPMGAVTADSLDTLRIALNGYEARHRKQLPAGMPAFDEEAGVWGAAMLFRACQFVVYRSLDEKAIEAQLGGDPPSPTPAAHYSVDLCFQYLPDCIAYARSASEDDPLVAKLIEWAELWPYSSVGVAGVSVRPERVETFLTHRPLLESYVDRVVLADDVERIHNRSVEEAVRAVIGAHAVLAPPRIARKLQLDTANATSEA